MLEGVRERERGNAECVFHLFYERNKFVNVVGATPRIQLADAFVVVAV